MRVSTFLQTLVIPSLISNFETVFEDGPTNFDGAVFGGGCLHLHSAIGDGSSASTLLSCTAHNSGGAGGRFHLPPTSLQVTSFLFTFIYLAILVWREGIIVS